VAAPGSVAAVLGLQRRVGNIATCQAVGGRCRVTVQRGHELPLGPPESQDPRWKDPGTVTKAAKDNKAAAGGLVVLKQKSGNFWSIHPELSHEKALNSLKQCKPNVTYVNAFVEPFHPEHRDQLWLMTRFDKDKQSGELLPGSWGKGSGSHTSAGYAPAIAAGELMWRLRQTGPGEYDVEVLASNQQTQIYAAGAGEGGTARATQSDRLADYQRLLYYGLSAFKESPYFSGASQLAATEDPAQLQPGQYMVRTVPLSEGERQKLLERGIKPEGEYVTYRPTGQDRLADEQQRRYVAEGRTLSIIKIDPLQGTVVSTWMKITGTNLGVVDRVGFGAEPNRVWVRPNVTSGVEVSVMVPTAATTGKVAIKNRIGQVVESSDTFTVLTAA
jgi:hypothetical protein